MSGILSNAVNRFWNLFKRKEEERISRKDLEPFTTPLRRCNSVIDDKRIKGAITPDRNVWKTPGLADCNVWATPSISHLDNQLQSSDDEDSGVFHTPPTEKKAFANMSDLHQTPAFTHKYIPVRDRSPDRTANRLKRSQSFDSREMFVKSRGADWHEKFDSFRTGKEDALQTSIFASNKDNDKTRRYKSVYSMVNLSGSQQTQKLSKIPIPKRYIIPQIGDGNVADARSNCTGGIETHQQMTPLVGPQLQCSSHQRKTSDAGSLLQFAPRQQKVTCNEQNVRDVGPDMHLSSHQQKATDVEPLFQFAPHQQNSSDVGPMLQFEPHQKKTNDLGPMLQFEPHQQKTSDVGPMLQFEPQQKKTNDLGPMLQFEPHQQKTSDVRPNHERKACNVGPNTYLEFHEQKARDVGPNTHLAFYEQKACNVGPNTHMAFHEQKARDYVGPDFQLASRHRQKKRDVGPQIQFASQRQRARQVARRSRVSAAFDSLFVGYCNKKYRANLIDWPSHCRWTREAGVRVDQDGNAFRKSANGKIDMNITEYKCFLKKMCDDAGSDYWETLERMTNRDSD